MRVEITYVPPRWNSTLEMWAKVMHPIATLNVGPTSGAICRTVQRCIRVQDSIARRGGGNSKQTGLHSLRNHADIDIGWIDVGEVRDGQGVTEHVETSRAKIPKKIP